MMENWVVFKTPGNFALNFAESTAAQEMPIEEIGNNTGFYFSPFYSKDKVYAILGEAKTVAQDELNNLTFTFINHEITVNHNKEHYLQLVANAVKLMNLTEPPFIKVVLANNKFIAQNVNPIGTFINLCNHYPNAFVYLLHTRQFGLWLGASPELLIGSVGSNQYQTMSLAGTLGPDRSQWTEKEKEEQLLVTQYIEASLAELNMAFTTEPTTELISGNLRHLMNIINFEMPLNRIGAYLKRLHPTPAVGGLPKNKALEFINTHEQLNRSLYAGFLGYLCPEKTQIHVNLRCAQIIQTGLLYYAGAGITHLSHPENEWQETQRKMEAVATRVV